MVESIGDALKSSKTGKVRLRNQDPFRNLNQVQFLTHYFPKLWGISKKEEENIMMKLEIDGYEVIISAKKWGDRRSKKETCNLLSEISLFLNSYHLDHEKAGTSDALTRLAGIMSNEIYDALDSIGYYDDVKGE